jgi:RES domain-containing protein
MELQNFQKNEHCVLIVTSALAPNETNWLQNPRHAGSQDLISKPEPLTFDPRMFGTSR